jgi:hypothetical protein
MIIYMLRKRCKELEPSIKFRESNWPLAPLCNNGAYQPIVQYRSVSHQHYLRTANDKRCWAVIR